MPMLRMGAASRSGPSSSAHCPTDSSVTKKLLIIAPVGLLLIAAAVVKLVLLAPAPVDEQALSKEPGPVYALSEPFVVNLRDRGEHRRFAKVGLALRLSKLSADHVEPAAGDAPAWVEEDPELRDIVIRELQARSARQLATPEGRASLKKAIVQKINAETDLAILDVYYTEFAVQ